MKILEKFKGFVRKLSGGKKRDALLCNRGGPAELYRYWVSLRGGRHTSFLAGRCKKCGGWVVFPEFNFWLAIREGTEEAHNFLATNGIPVDKMKEEASAKGLPRR